MLELWDHNSGGGNDEMLEQAGTSRSPKPHVSPVRVLEFSCETPGPRRPKQVNLVLVGFTPNN